MSKELSEKEKIESIQKYMVRKPEDFCTFRMLWQFFVTKVWYNMIFTLFYRYEVEGKENIPKNCNNYIAVGNHLSTLDPVLMATILPNPIAFMAKKELFYHPILKILLDTLGAFAVDREKVGISTITTAKSLVKTKKWILGLFPQGTREKAGKITTVKKGFLGLAKATKCNILPMGIFGTDKKAKIPFTGKIVVKIGKMIEFTDNQDEMFDKWIASMQELTGFKYEPQEEE
ncbi:MAG: 1-acyl-sn-glycerol-3-phosphate acyltransferase [bacterium]|nr:1-acyl-sn-glycerol-3-phosphate acyltransferase [bacterium]